MDSTFGFGVGSRSRGLQDHGQRSPAVETLPGLGRAGLRWLRIGGCTPPAGRLRPQAVRGGLPSPRTSAMAGGVDHLHESTVTGGHHDGPDNFTPLLLPSADRSLLPDGVPPRRCAGGGAQPAPADRRPGIGCTGREAWAGGGTSRQRQASPPLSTSTLPGASCKRQRRARPCVHEFGHQPQRRSSSLLCSAAPRRAVKSVNAP